MGEPKIDIKVDADKLLALMNELAEANARNKKLQAENDDLLEELQRLRDQISDMKASILLQAHVRYGVKR